MAKPFANSEDPDQTPHSAASDLGLHCLPITLLGVSRLKWINLSTEASKFLVSTHNICFLGEIKKKTYLSEYPLI